MRRFHISRTIDAPPAAVWDLLVDLQRWPQWGPSVRSATIDDDHLRLGSLGSVVTVAGVSLPFEVTHFVPGRSWSWKVAGIPATDHAVEPLGDDRCRLTFGVPAVAAGYLVVCRVALRRLDEMARATAPG